MGGKKGTEIQKCNIESNQIAFKNIFITKTNVQNKKGTFQSNWVIDIYIYGQF